MISHYIIKEGIRRWNYMFDVVEACLIMIIFIRNCNYSFEVNFQFNFLKSIYLVQAYLFEVLSNAKN